VTAGRLVAIDGRANRRKGGDAQAGVEAIDRAIGNALKDAATAA
jgi:hypothetical protein